MLKKAHFRPKYHIEQSAVAIGGGSGIREADRQQSSMFSYISAELRVPKDHLLRAVRGLEDAVLACCPTYPRL